MPKIKQYIQRRSGQPRPRHSQGSGLGVRLTPEGIGEFLDACRAEGRVEGTMQWYERGIRRLYGDVCCKG